MFNFNSVYLPFANQTLEWFNTDSKELYDKNLINNYNKLKQFDWINKRIEYKFNSLGFRSDEFVESSIMFLGCSFTFGVGIPLEETWTNIVSKHVNLPAINLGQAGGSPDTAFRLALGYVEKFKPNIIVYLQPPSTRLELVSANNIHFLFPNNSQHNPFYKEWIKFDDLNATLNAEKNKLAIEQLASKANSKFLHFNYDDFPQLDFARDLIHWGTASHSAFADKVLNLLRL